MMIKKIEDMKQSIGEVLRNMGTQGALLETPESQEYAILPLDDDLLDYLLERNPVFVDQCQQVRQRMKAGAFHSHDDVKKLLGL